MKRVLNALAVVSLSAANNPHTEEKPCTILMNLQMCVLRFDSVTMQRSAINFAWATSQVCLHLASNGLTTWENIHELDLAVIQRRTWITRQHTQPLNDIDFAFKISQSTEKSMSP